MDSQNALCVCVCVLNLYVVCFCMHHTCACTPLYVPPVRVQHAGLVCIREPVCACMHVCVCECLCTCSRLLSRHALWLHAVPHQTVKPIPFCH